MRRWTEPKIRVVLADDHEAMRARIRLELGEEFEIVAMAEDGQEAIDAVLLYDRDVLLIDISLPVMDGFTCGIGDVRKDPSFSSCKDLSLVTVVNFTFHFYTDSGA